MLRKSGHRGILLGLVVTGVAACGRDTIGAPDIPENDQFWALTTNVHSVTMAAVSPYDTIRVVATARNAFGTPISAPPPVTFRTTDDQAVTVTGDGLITARRPAMGVNVIVQASVGNVTHADTIPIEITDTVPSAPLGRLSFTTPDSAKFAASYFFEAQPVLQVKAFNSRNEDVSGSVRTALQSSDPSIIRVHTDGSMEFLKPGAVTITATTTWYGVTKRDTLRFTSGLPLMVIFGIVATTPAESRTPLYAFSPDVLTMGVGGFALWSNTTTGSIDVVFDDSLKVSRPDQSIIDAMGVQADPGNIPPLTDGTAGSLDAYAIRAFRHPGTYTFHSRLHPEARGTLIIKTE